MTLARRTPLARGGELARTPLRRKTAMRRVAAAKRTVAKQRKQRDTGPDAETKALLWDRARGRCEICGAHATSTWPGFSRHHRSPRGMGGTRAPWVNDVTNLLLLCGTGTLGCHGAVERNRAVAYDAGWLVRTGEDPAGIPVYVFNRTRPVYLDRAGTYVEGNP